MLNKIKILTLLLCLFSIQFISAQTSKEKALSKGQEAIKLMDNGKVAESIKLLEEAQKLDPDKFDYSYELAYAHYLKEDFKYAIKILEKNINHKEATDRLFQLLGNSYDLLGKTDKAFESYDAGLEKFPNSGIIYLEKGNIYWAKKEYAKALPFYEKGIEVEPTFPSNYYRAARIYCGSTEEVWGMIYGEIFMNLERNTKRTAEISKLLYETYRSEIKVASDSSFSVSFSQNATINVSDLNSKGNMKLPFGIGVYEPTLMFSILTVKAIDINSLDNIRSAFVAGYFGNGHNKTYPNLLFDHQKKVKDAGHMSAYNHWILMKGDEDNFQKWVVENSDKWDNFLKWFSENGMVVNEGNKFNTGQY